MTTNTFVKYLLLLAILAPLAIGQRYSTILFESYHHEINADYFQSYTLQLVNYSNHRVFDGCFVLSRDVDKFDARFEAVVPKKAGKPWTLLNVTLDGCKLIDSINPASKQWVQLIVGTLKSNSAKFPDKCPLEQAKEYCYTNFSLDAVNFPSYFPETKLNFTYTIKQKNIAMAKHKFAVKIQRKNN